MREGRNKLYHVLSFDRTYMTFPVNNIEIAWLADVYARNMNTAHALGSVLKNVIESEHLVLEDEARKERGEPSIIDNFLLENDSIAFQGFLDFKQEIMGGLASVKPEAPKLKIPEIIERAERSRSLLLKSGIEALCNSVHNEAWVALEVLRNDLCELIKSRVDNSSADNFSDRVKSEINESMLVKLAREARHIRLHRAGKIDSKSIKAMQKVGIAADKFDIGGFLVVPGEYMLASINACIHFSRKMLSDAEIILELKPGKN